LHLHSEQNIHIENYFLKIYENEKSEFENCIKEENQTQKKCKISNLGNDASYLLFGKNFFMRMNTGRYLNLSLFTQENIRNKGLKVLQLQNLIFLLMVKLLILK
jgi:hypothetical protein